jgi:single-strand DNA-binding protein
MASMNHITLIGHLGQDPKDYSKEGKKVAAFSLATNRSWTSKDGQSHNETDWHDIVVFGKLADICLQHLKKASQVCVEGELVYRTWDHNGESRRSASIRAKTVLFLGSKPKVTEVPAGEVPNPEDDLPF